MSERRLNWFQRQQIQLYQETGLVLMFPQHLKVFGFWRGLWVYLRYDVLGYVIFWAVIWGAVLVARWFARGGTLL